jgi:Uma2 family endonuclease
VVAKNNDYLASHQVPVDIILVVEVADSSVEFDRSVKRELYAVSGIEKYWIMNLPERYWEARAGGLAGDLFC